MEKYKKAIMELIDQATEEQLRVIIAFLRAFLGL